MTQVIAIATADWHLHKFQNFDVNGSRLDWALKAAREIMDKAYNLKVPLLFAGDLIHSPKQIENKTNAEVQALFQHKVRTYAISGNHDMCERNGYDFRSPSHWDAINGNVINLNHADHGNDTLNFVVWGIDYMNNDRDLKKAIEHIRPQAKEWKVKFKILMLHTDLPGVTTNEGFELKETENIPKNLDKFFKEWDLVICGHIHKPQKVSSKVYMLGCPIAQDAGNIGQELGYWLIYDNGAMDFVPMDNYPKFVRLKKGEEKPKDTIDYYIEPEEVLVEENIEMGEFHLSNSKAKLAKRYLAQKQIKSKSKRRALIKILNEE